MATPIGTLGNVPTLNIGGRIFTDTANLIYLVSRVTTANNCVFRQYDGTAGYTPSGATSFVAYSMRYYAADITPLTATGYSSIGYNDVDFGYDVATAPTTPIYPTGGSNGFIFQGPATLGNVNTAFVDINFKFTTPNGKYLFLFGNGASAGTRYYQVFGYEV